MPHVYMDDTQAPQDGLVFRIKYHLTRERGEGM